MDFAVKHLILFHFISTWFLGQLLSHMYDCETFGLANSKSGLQVLLCPHQAEPLWSLSLTMFLASFIYL